MLQPVQENDWLKKHHKRFPPISANTLYNFLMTILGQKYAIAVEKPATEYFVAEKLPNCLQTKPILIGTSFTTQMKSEKKFISSL